MRENGVICCFCHLYIQRTQLDNSTGKRIIFHHFSTGTLSPVIGAWLTEPVPAAALPSTGISHLLLQEYRQFANQLSELCVHPGFLQLLFWYGTD